jgi:DNA-directed RNA polymerase specialized sigma24 family protein
VTTLPPFHNLIDEHRGTVLGFLRGMVGPNDAEDCLQDTFLAALRAYPAAERGNLRAWLFQIARNKAIDHHRKRSTAPLAGGDPGDLDGAAPATAPDWLGGGFAAGMNDRDGEVWMAVGRLPAGQRAAVLLRFAVDLRYGEIGAALGCSEDAARRRVHDGLRALRAAADTALKEVA